MKVARAFIVCAATSTVHFFKTISPTLIWSFSFFTSVYNYNLILFIKHINLFLNFTLTLCHLILYIAITLIFREGSYGFSCVLVIKIQIMGGSVNKFLILGFDIMSVTINKHCTDIHWLHSSW